MGNEFFSSSGFLLMFVLGLRHGLDPDHIACIDGLTWRALDNDKRLAPWVGTLFAIGHGLLVTAIAVGVSMLSHAIPVSDQVAAIFKWVPTLLLFLVGTLNLRQLLSPSGNYRPIGWKLRFIPKRLLSHSNPAAILFVGVLFAAVFDTATQASAWGYVATNEGGVFIAFVAGLVFTLGMVLTDSIDGRLLCRIMARTDGLEVSRRYRRSLGWVIVSLSFGVGSYNIAKEFLPTLELNDMAYSAVGFSLLLLAFLTWAHKLHANWRSQK